jgi:hypothetical protein
MTKPKLKIKNVKDLGPQFVENQHHMVGQDGAFSIPLNGESLWFFGDTLIGTRKIDESPWYYFELPEKLQGRKAKGIVRKMITNCGLLLPKQSAGNGLQDYRYIRDRQGELRFLVPPLPGEDPEQTRTWCMHGISIHEKIYLCFIKIQMLENADFPQNFKVLGAGLAEGSNQDWIFKHIFHQGSELLWKNTDPQFGSAVIKDPHSHWVYFYGVRNDQKGNQLVYLSRVQASDITRRDRYEFLTNDDPSWSPNVSEVQSIFDGPPNEMSVSYNSYLDSYLAVHSVGLGGEIVARNAPQPWGPWSEVVLISKVISRRTEILPYPPQFYAGKEHPALSEQNGKILYITYVDFDEYFPHLLQVELS